MFSKSGCWSYKSNRELDSSNGFHSFLKGWYSVSKLEHFFRVSLYDCSRVEFSRDELRRRRSSPSVEFEDWEKKDPHLERGFGEDLISSVSGASKGESGGVSSKVDNSEFSSSVFCRFLNWSSKCWSVSSQPCIESLEYLS